MGAEVQGGAPRPRLYLTTPPRLDPDAFAPLLEAAIEAGDVASVKLRLIDAPEDAVTTTVERLRPICHRHDVALLIADYFRLVRPLGLDGVHFEDGQNAQIEARELLGGAAVIGVGCGASRDRGMTAGERGADYVSFGPVAVDEGLRVGEPADRALFQWWQEMIELPVVAEGGMTPALAEALCGAADFIGVSRSVWEHADGPAAAVEAYMSAIARGMENTGGA